MLKAFIKTTPFGLSLLLLSISLGLLALIAPINGTKALIVRSGSMQPAIGTGDLILVRPQQSYKIGDVISFSDPAKAQTTVTHRIADVQIQNGQIFYQTKGDANEEADFTLVPAKNVIGQADYSIRSVGKLFAQIKTREGFLAAIIIPAVFVILSEIFNITREIKKGKNRSPKIIYQKTMKHLYLHYGKPMGISHPSASFKSLLLSFRKSTPHSGQARMTAGSLRTLLPFVAILLLVGNTFSFFTDTETSASNLFQAASSFPTPVPFTDHLVINEVMFDPPNENVCGNEGDAEWVEIYNPTASSVNLDTWLVGDTLFTDDLPNVILPAGGFAIVSDCTQSSFVSIWSMPGGTIYIDLPSVIGNGLNNGGEHIRLLNGTTLIDAMSYGSNTDAFSPSATAPVADHSLEREPDGVDTNTAADFVDRTTPTPGI